MVRPSPPYYIVSFVSQLNLDFKDEYNSVAKKLVEIAQEQSGFIHIESERNEEGKGLTLSYWESKESLDNWKSHPEHKKAQLLGKEKYYESFHIDVAFVDK